VDATKICRKKDASVRATNILTTDFIHDNILTQVKMYSCSELNNHALSAVHQVGKPTKHIILLMEAVL